MNRSDPMFQFVSPLMSFLPVGRSSSSFNVHMTKRISVPKNISGCLKKIPYQYLCHVTSRHRYVGGKKRVGVTLLKCLLKIIVQDGWPEICAMEESWTPNPTTSAKRKIYISKILRSIFYVKRTPIAVKRGRQKISKTWRTKNQKNLL